MIFRLTFEQMKRLEVSKPTENQFPYSYICIFNKHFGKNIEVPKLYVLFAIDSNFFGRLHND
jgi:hypothetical protein